MKKITFLIALMLPVLMWAVNPKPFVVPELRQWEGKDGSLSVQPSTKIIAESPEAVAVADMLAADWLEMFGSKLQVAACKPSKGDIVLAIKPDRKLNSEGYSISIGDRIDVSAPTKTGLYWATRTILQIAEQSESRELPKGKIVDWPDYGLRGMSMDVGRKFFPLDYLRDLVKVMSYYKMNSLRVHLNDNGFPQFFSNDWDKTYAAFRMESDRFPGLTARDGFYTKKDFRQFQLDAAGRMVDIVPEIDVPAHSLAFSHYKPEIGSKEFGMDHLDLFNPETTIFIDSVFDEYLSGDEPVFAGEYVHIGTDEFGKDYPGFDRKKEMVELFRKLTDHYIRLVESYGKKPWVWGALSNARGETPIKTQGVMLDAWYNGYADPKEMVELGFKINSIPDGMVYIVPMAGYYYDYLNTAWLYDNWTPAVVGKVKFEELDPNIAGGYFAVWNDHVGNGVSVQDVHHRIIPALQTMSVKLWDGVNATVPYAEFDSLRHALSEAPGVNRLARVGVPGSLVFEAEKLMPSSKTGIDDLGYDYTVEFDLEAADEVPGTVLFRSDNSTFYLADPVKGMMGFQRDGYLNSLNFKPYPGEKVHLKITGDNRSTKLYVNGRLFTSLDPVKQYYSDEKNAHNSKMYYLATLVFPLREAGQFNSRISNLKVYNDIR